MSVISELSGTGLKQEAFKLCKEFLNHPWDDVEISDFKFTTVSGGLSNYLYCCSLRDNISISNPKVPRHVLLRIYGPIQDEFLVIVDTTTFMLLSEKHLGPKLYGIFPKGRLEEYIPSRSLKTDDIREMSTTIAKEMAKIHALDVPVQKKPEAQAAQICKWIQELENETLSKHGQSFSLRNFYKEEIEWIIKEMKATKSPVVYCHNDLQGGNILLLSDSRENEPNILLIDFEFGCYNYRGFDIANHFCEWAFDYNTPEYPHYHIQSDKYPTKEQQVEYITAYLIQLSREGCLEAAAFSTETEKILEEVKLFAMASHLYWSLWGEKMNIVVDIDFDHVTHSEARRNIYSSLKEKYLERESKIVKGE